ncbi:hypothetical protein CJI33_03745 [Campylobacter jejuni]|nr:hypothetical protein [Campylobacter jejuni]EHL3397435.1 hypothetical protein [Campylobacter jejuni]
MLIAIFEIIAHKLQGLQKNYKAIKDVEVEFEIGGRGDFIVEVDGKVIFSKTQLINCESERFPYQNEINQLIKNRV